MVTNEIDILKQFEDSKEFKEHFTLKSNVILRKEDNYFSFDCAIYKDARIFAVVEIKHSIRSDESLENARKQVQRAMGMLNCNYGIITDGKEFYVVGKKDSEFNRYSSLNDVIELLTQNLSQNNPTDDISAEIKELLTKYKMEEFIKKMTHNSSNYTFLKKDEYNFILKLIHKNEPTPTYYFRYMSFESAFKTLHKKKYRMNSIVGMNDKSEVDYFNKNIYGSSSDNQDTTNDIFISSFSSLEDDLTMWRLYGDDGRGVCLVFELKSTPKRFMHSKVCYDDEPLNLLRKLVEIGWIFRNDEEWKHLFKTKEYAVENEYRLLYRKKGKNFKFIKEEDWYIRQDTGIVSKYITFDLNAKEFPFILRKVIVGPKCIEKNLNIEQLRNITKQYDDEVIFSPSKIITYR